VATRNTSKPHKPALSKDKEKRQRQLAQLKYERQMQARVEKVRRARRNALVIGSSVLAVVLIAGGVWWGVSSGGKKKTVSADKATPTASASASPSTTAKAAAAHVAGCTTPSSAKPATMSWKTEPAIAIDTSASYTATINTNCGPITLKLDAAAAPHTVNSFVFLAEHHYFDHVTCARLVNSGLFLLQCGDPTGTGSGGPGYTFGNENLGAFGKAGSDGSVTYPAGTIAMANTGQPDSNGSQFFLVYKNSPLAPSYTPFGTITGGLSTLQAIGAAGDDGSNSAGGGKPNQPVVMNSVTTVKS
jgi:peptidyl-prolyl cis-trans isomerase B (cyclophilin B)